MFIANKFQSYEDFMHYLEEVPVINHNATTAIH
jgi:hypothetical protein